jgi:hypothetical protein
MVRTDLDFHGRLGFFYFRATPDLTTRQLDYKSLVMDTERDVFKGYEAEPGGRVKYYRHSAFYGRFHRYDRRWHLEITPTYHFTSDGYRLRSGYQGLLKGIKAQEGHLAVRGQLVMWGAYLSPRGDMFADDPYPYLGFGDLETISVERGIDDTSWTALRVGSNGSPQKAESVESAEGPAMLPLFA